MVLDIGRVKHRADLMHKSIGSNGLAVASNWILSADGQKNVVWTPRDAAGGGSFTLGANGSNSLSGAVFLQAGPGIALGVASQTITVNNIAGSSGGGGSGPTDYVSGASGSGQIIIPGLAGSADIRVAGANDDEFDTTDTSDPMTGWTTLGTPGAHNINSHTKSHYYIMSNTASVTLVGIYKSVPSIPFTVTTHLTGFTIFSTPVRYTLFIGEAGGAGKLESIGLDGGLNTTAVDIWNSRTSFNSQTGAIGTPVLGRMPLYLQITVTLSTSVTYRTSIDGRIWTANVTARNPGFTVGIVGLCINGTGGITEALYDWIRFT